jgi:predicted transcriptional regulator
LKEKDIAALFKTIAPLENPTRLKILLLIEQKPGIRFSEIRNETGLDSNNLNHHLIELKKRGFAKSSGGYKITKYGRNASSVIKHIMDDPAMNKLLAQAKRRSIV